MRSESEDSSDETFIPTSQEPKSKLNIMGMISSTGDRLNLSNRQKAMMAAACVKACGGKIEETNISYSTACRQGKKVRMETADAIKNSFSAPENSIIHWNGKILKLEAGKSSERCCVYITGASEEKCQKLLGVPDISNGTGEAQKEAVMDLLKDWDISDRFKGQVFDTTSSNSGARSGACVLIEQMLDRAILWLPCRHHIYELHIKHASIAVTGETKDPGVQLF